MGGSVVYGFVKYHSKWTRNEVCHCLEHIIEKHRVTMNVRQEVK